MAEIDVVGDIKQSIRNAAASALKVLETSHGVENVSVVFKETAKGITVTVKGSGSVVVADDAGDVAEELLATDDPIEYLDK